MGRSLLNCLLDCRTDAFEPMSGTLALPRVRLSIASRSTPCCHAPPLASRNFVRSTGFCRLRRATCSAAAESAEGAVQEEEEAENVVEETTPTAGAEQKRSRKKKIRSKRFSQLSLNLPMGEASPMDAINALKERASASFDETVELNGKTSLDPRYADQQLRATGAKFKDHF